MKAKSRYAANLNSEKARVVNINIHDFGEALFHDRQEVNGAEPPVWVVCSLALNLPSVHLTAVHPG